MALGFWRAAKPQVEGFAGAVAWAGLGEKLESDMNFERSPSREQIPHVVGLTSFFLAQQT